MQADGGFVEDVAHAAQVGAELRRQADALRLAARQRGRGAVQRQVAEAHVLQEGEAAADLAHQVAGDVGLALVQCQVGEEAGRPVHRLRRELVQAEVAEAHRARHRVEARAVAGRAGFVADDDFFRVAEVERVRVLDARRGLQPGAVAFGAPAVLGVVREQARIRLGEAGAAARAGAQRGEGDRHRTELADLQHLITPLADLQRLAHELAQRGFALGLHHHHAGGQLDVVLLVAVQPRPFWRWAGIRHRRAAAHGPAARPLGEIGVQALAVDHQRRQHLDRGAAQLALELARRWPRSSAA